MTFSVKTIVTKNNENSLLSIYRYKYQISLCKCWNYLVIQMLVFRHGSNSFPSFLYVNYWKVLMISKIILLQFILGSGYDIIMFTTKKETQDFNKRLIFKRESIKTFLI